MCAAVSASLSAAIRAGRRSAIGDHRQSLHQAAQRQLVAVRSETANHGDGNVCDGRPTSLGLARVNVGEMHFDERNLYSSERITNRQTRVTVRPRVHQRAISATTQRLNRVDDIAFAVVLRERELNAELFGHGQEMRLNVGQRFLSIKFGLTRAEQIEVWAINDCDSHSPVSPSSQARNLATSSSDSCACGSRGLTRGVGIGGVGGVVRAPGVPLNAPASRDAARLSAGFTCAPAKTASSDAPAAPLPITGAVSAGAIADAFIGGISGLLCAAFIPPVVP